MMLYDIGNNYVTSNHYSIIATSWENILVNLPCAKVHELHERSVQLCIWRFFRIMGSPKTQNRILQLYAKSKNGSNLFRRTSHSISKWDLLEYYHIMCGRTPEIFVDILWNIIFSILKVWDQFKNSKINFALGLLTCEIEMVLTAIITFGSPAIHPIQHSILWAKN